MKDIIIRGATIRRELFFFLLSFIIAFGMNLYAIITFKTLWAELLTQLPFLILVTLVIYLIILLARIVFLGINKLLRIKKNKSSV